MLLSDTLLGKFLLPVWKLLEGFALVTRNINDFNKRYNTAGQALHPLPAAV